MEFFSWISTIPLTTPRSSQLPPTAQVQIPLFQSFSCCLLSSPFRDFEKREKESQMAFASFVGRVLFALIFILSAYQDSALDMVRSTPTNAIDKKGCNKVRVRHSCSLKKLRDKTKRLSEEHLNLIKTTPFSFILDLPSCEPNSNLLQSLISGWDIDAVGFKFANTFVPFTPIDVSYILGLRSIGSEIRVKEDLGKSRVQELLDMYFPGQPRRIKLLDDLFEKVDLVDDMCRVYIAYAFSTFLFSLTGTGFHGHFFKLLDDLKQLNDFCWGGAVYDFLVDGIKQAGSTLKHNTRVTEVRIKGCSPLLQLWVLEHTMVIQRPRPQWPRLFTWSSTSVTTAIAKSLLTVSDDDEVLVRLQPFRNEKSMHAIKELLKRPHCDSSCSKSPPSPPTHIHKTTSDHLNVGASDYTEQPNPPSEMDDHVESPHHSCRISYQHLLQEHAALREEFNSKCQQCEIFMTENESLRAKLSQQLVDYDVLMRLYEESTKSQCEPPFPSPPQHSSPAKHDSPIGGDDIPTSNNPLPEESSPIRCPSSNVVARMRKNPRKRCRGQALRSPWTGPTTRGNLKAPSQAGILRDDDVDPTMLQWLQSHIFFKLENKHKSTVAEIAASVGNSRRPNIGTIGHRNSFLDLKFIHPLVAHGRRSSSKRWISTEGAGCKPASRQISDMVFKQLCFDIDFVQPLRSQFKCLAFL